MPMTLLGVTSLHRRLWRSKYLPKERFWPNPARDIYLVTYPRSGTTWISCIAVELLFKKSPKKLTEMNLLVPEVHVLPEKSMVPPATQYLIKSHFPFNSVHGSSLPTEYRRVIYLIRDPRDVMLSYHRYRRYMSNYPGDLKEFALDLVAGRIWPCSWQEHVNSWLAPRSRVASLEMTVIRYEDFVADPFGQTQNLAKVLGIEADQARIEEIVADTSPAAMREREINGNNGTDPEFNFIGPAIAGSWKKLRTRDDCDAVAILEEFAGSAMQRGNYNCSNGAASNLSSQSESRSLAWMRKERIMGSAD